MADLNTPHEFEGTTGIGSGIAFDHIADIDNSSEGRVSVPIRPGRVEAIFISATDEVADDRSTTINTKRNT